MNKYKIAIVTTEPFPLGLAATNRIKHYCKGFIVLGHSVSVFVLKSTSFSGKGSLNPEGVIDNNIPYRYLSGKTKKPNNIFLQIIEYFRIILNLINVCRSNKTNVIIYYSTNIFFSYILFIITKIYSIIYLKEESEFRIKYKKYSNKLEEFFFIKHYSLFDGLLLMTRPLINYFIDKLNFEKPILHVPMTVDWERFKYSNSDNNNIIYIGTINQHKDGVLTLVKAFEKIRRNYLYLILEIYGPTDNKEGKEIQNYVVKNGLEKVVIFKGLVPIDSIPQILNKAKLLVLSRPSSIQAEGGFPTKLGEYLSTGKPVIVTDVGEISTYLKDGVNAYISEPDSVEAFSNKMKEVLKNYDKAKQVGIKGQEAVLEHFNYKVQAKNIIEFIEKKND